MSGNNCANCGQWSGRGHACPTPPATRNTDDPTPPAALPSANARENVTERVARAQAAITNPPHPGTQIEDDQPAPTSTGNRPVRITPRRNKKPTVREGFARVRRLGG